ncbi:hypothetical protein OBBRIDRAFT_794532 [Obba rivulosa]|uniref:Fe2OG dioxygenase domain-containing protein n=1 Tax=Obba rivulosa TaxID=1052685 RepID=A0A8E2AW60_9APHY|nr:hypothetical protein OBBRIDRAFT_794532 [Obba rivulosa]
MNDSVDEQLKALQAALSSKPPFCSGVLEVLPENLVLYYGKDGNLGRIDFASASEDKLKHLTSVCDPATFGRNDRDVYDETYRKAGKLDAAYFAAKFDPQSSGLLDAIRGDLLEGDRERPIRAELYKLNVYGPGSFFKAHMDTPRGSDMFGSLVLVFPAAHEGGAIELRHEGAEWTFDSATALAASQKPSIGYVAFFSDVEHEVTPIRSGYRVTVTYNLYYAAESDAVLGGGDRPVARDPPANEAAFKAGLRALLEDEAYMPDGGVLGFGLRHQYPCDRQDPTKNDLKQFERRLKGSDAMLLRVCRALGLEASVQVVYKTYAGSALLDRVVDFEDRDDPEEDVVYWLKSTYNGMVLKSEYTDEEYEVSVSWVTPYARNDAMSLPFMTYGNEADVTWAYIHLCLVVKVPAVPRAVNV